MQADGLDTNFTVAKKTVVTAELDTELTEMEYAQVLSPKKKKIRAIRGRS